MKRFINSMSMLVLLGLMSLASAKDIIPDSIKFNIVELTDPTIGVSCGFNLEASSTSENLLLKHTFLISRELFLTKTQMQKTENQKIVFPKLSFVWVSEGDLANYALPDTYNGLLNAYAKTLKYDRPLTTKGGKYLSSVMEADNILVQQSKDPRVGTEGFLVGSNNYRLSVQTEAGEIATMYINPKFSAEELEKQSDQFKKCLNDQRLK